MSHSNALPPDPLNADFWEGRYQEGSARWDLGQPAPPLVSLLAAAQAPPVGRMIALGIGPGHDALLFADKGFDVVGVDFAPSAIAATAAAARTRHLSIQLLQRDLFDLIPEYAGQFDYVLEHTCFCAIALDRRAEYVQLARTLLKPSGEFIGLFWAHSRPGGPPFGTSVSEIRHLFQPEFIVDSLTPITNSVPARAQEEFLARFPVRSPN